MLIMRKETFLLEIGSEEIPARFMTPTIKLFRESAAKELQAQRLDHGEIKAYGTPRRLALLVSALADKQQDLYEKKKGPAAKAAFDVAGNPTKAAVGFASSQGIAVSDLYVEEFDGVPYVFAVRQEAGCDTQSILPELCVRLIKNLAFPKPMFWYSKDIRFARPIRWLTAIFGKQQITFEFAGLRSAKTSYGHRFLAPAPVALADAAYYLEDMRKLYVIADPLEREKQIISLVDAAAAELGGHTQVDADLLEEVVNLVEYPQAVTGHFAEDYLETPSEVLVTAMRAHQRYFPVFDANNQLLPHFITISNGTREEFTANVRAGNERVLRARLADARFFFNEDRKKPLEAFVDELDKIVFMESLGTMRKKTQRLVGFSEMLAVEFHLNEQVKAAATRAAYLAKADLMTHLVYEFPELQGTMGMHYARLSGETIEVATAIHEHYAPRFAGDKPAQALPGAVVAIADKMDTLAACFGLGLLPTGSQDPYALRRGAVGVVATLIAHNLTISLPQLCEFALGGLAENLTRSLPEIKAEMEEFLLQRVRFSFTELGMRYDVLDAVLAGTARDLPGLLARAQVLQAKLDSPELAMLLTPYTRAANLTREIDYHEVDPTLFISAAESSLYQAAQAAKQEVEAGAAACDFQKVFGALAPLHQPIANFFNDVMVMAEDQAVRQNRLALLTMVKNLFLLFGDISKLVQEKK